MRYTSETMNDLIKDRNGEIPPPDGYLKVLNDGGQFRVMRSDGKKFRCRPEAGTPVHASYCSQTLTLTGRAVADETITIGGVTYTWKATATAANEVEIGASTAAHDILALVAAINASTAGSDEDLYGEGTVANPYWSAADGSGDTVVLTALAVGPTSGPANSETMTNASFGSMTAGTWATEGSAGDELYDASYRYIANADVLKTSTAGWERTATAAF